MSTNINTIFLTGRHLLKLILLLLVLYPLGSQAQWDSGTITYERKVNAEFLMREMRNSGGIEESAYQEYVVSQPKFKSSMFTLKFKRDSSSYYPTDDGPIVPVSTSEWFTMCGFSNRIKKNTKEGIGQWEKEVFGSKYSIADTLRPIKWKITTETRNIAGFECRRANAVIMDSIYVVAFYTTDLHSSDGPESLHGLPGLILGAALPHDHISWFAVSVNTDQVDLSKDRFFTDRKNLLTQLEYTKKIDQLTASWITSKDLIKKRVLF